MRFERIKATSDILLLRSRFPSQQSIIFTVGELASTRRLGFSK